MDTIAHSTGSKGDETMKSIVVPPTYTSTSTPVAAKTQHLSPRDEALKTTNKEEQANVFVAGSLAVDLACDYQPRSDQSPSDETAKPTLYTSNPAAITQSLGGVGSNVARAAHLMGARVRLCSAVGDDLSGRSAVEVLNAAGMSVAGIKTLSSDSGSRTAQYVAVNDSNKDLMLAMADMSILESTATDPGSISASFDNFWLPQLQESKPSHLVLDANWPPQHLARWLEAAKSMNAHVTFEPVSTAKSTRLHHLPKPSQLQVFPNSSIHLTTPNAYELAAMHTAARESGTFDRTDWWEVVDAFGIPHSGARVQLALATSSDLVDQGIPQQSIQLLPFMPSICTKLGSQGVLLTQLIPANDERLSSGEYAPYILSRCANGTEDKLGVGGVYMRLFAAVQEVKREEIVSVNGVGDSFAGTLVTGLATRGPAARIEDLIDIAQRAAVLTLKSSESVSPGLGTLRILL
jgi:pseudouridine-5'-phosphate glycosidase/pseudouridine kinase